jgi:hypothetical protein
MALIRWTSYEKREIAQDVVSGLTPQEIADKRGRTLRAVKDKLAMDEELKGYIEKLQRSVDVMVAEEVGEKVAAARTRALERLADVAPEVVIALVELAIKSENESIRFKAAKAILDRLGVSLDVKRIQQVVEQRPPRLTEELAIKLQEALEAAASARRYRLDSTGHDEPEVPYQDLYPEDTT